MSYKSKLSGYAPQSNPCYQIEDIGPGGGTVFSIPGYGGGPWLVNNTNYYFEVAPHDVSTTQRSSAVMGQSCTGQQNSIPGAEFGVYKETILPSDNGTAIGDGKSNTAHLNSYPTSSGGNPTNPVLDTHTLAARECSNYVGPNGHTDWFLPSLDEASELLLNLGPLSPVGNIAHLNTSNANPADAFYWTSSVIPYSGYDEIALGVNTSVGSGAQMMDRCTTGSVRPIRMFECPVVSPQPSVDCHIITRDQINQRVMYFPDLASLTSPGTGAGTSLSTYSNILAMLPPTPPGYTGSANFGDGIACYGNKIWMTLCYWTSGGVSFTGAASPSTLECTRILELDFDSTALTVSFSRVINTNLSLPGGFMVHCSVDNATLLLTYDHYPNWPATANSVNEIYSFDISGTTAIGTLLFPTISGSADLAYIPSSNTYLSAEIIGGGGTRHYDASGILLGVSPLTGHSLFCHNGEVYLGRGVGGAGNIQLLDVANMSLGPVIATSQLGDAASNPECCNSSALRPIVSSGSKSEFKKIDFEKSTLEQQIKKWGI